MNKYTLFLMITVSVGASWHSVFGVLVEGVKWTINGNKEIVFFFDIHNQDNWKKRETDELEEVVSILGDYVKTANKPLYILVEEIYDPLGNDSLLSSLRTRLDEEKLTSSIVIENIEQRAASAAAEDLINRYSEKIFEVQRKSSTKEFFPHKVTLQDVFDEYASLITFLK